MVFELLVVAVSIALGYALHRCGGRTLSAISTFYLSIVIPITIFVSISRSSLAVMMMAVAVSCIHIVLMIVVSLFVGIVIYGTVRRAIVVSLPSSFPNVVFLGFPLSILLIGGVSPAVPYAIGFNIVFPIYVATVARLIGRRFDVRLTPLIIAFLAALSMKYLGIELEIPSSAALVLKYVNLCSIAIVVAEVLCRESGLRMLDTAVIAMLRFVVSPSIALMLAIFIDLGRELVYGLALQSVMPPAVVNAVVARALDLEPRTVATSIAVLTPISIPIAIATLTILKTIC